MFTFDGRGVCVYLFVCESGGEQHWITTLCHFVREQLVCLCAHLGLSHDYQHWSWGNQPMEQLNERWVCSSVKGNIQYVCGGIVIRSPIHSSARHLPSILSCLCFHRARGRIHPGHAPSLRLTSMTALLQTWLITVITIKSHFSFTHTHGHACACTRTHRQPCNWNPSSHLAHSVGFLWLLPHH